MQLLLQGYGGANRQLKPMLLPDHIGVDSLNHKPGRGGLEPWRQPLNVATIGAARATIYRMGRDVLTDVNYWLSWTTRVHAMRGFIPEDTTERTFYTGDGPPKQTDNTLALASPPYPTAWRYLGVPVPTTAPVLTPLAAGVATDTEIRYYVYTYVTDKGEESAPSPVSLPCSGKTDATWTITNLSPPPAGAYGVNRIRVYRTQTGQQGDTEFFFLREIVSTLDTTTDSGQALGEVMPTDGWLPPNSGMTCLTPMWNGMAAGIVAGAVRYCVPYKPYAWPVAYESLPPDAKAVGLGRWGQSLVVLTTGQPFLVQGSSSDALQDVPIDNFGESCISEPSIVSTGHGVCWASPDGLAYYGSNGAKLLTEGLMTRDDWQAINPTTIIGGYYEGAYIGFYTQGGVKKGFVIDTTSPDGIYFLETGYDGLFYDDLQDALYVIDGTAIRKWDAGASMMTATFRSKLFRTPPSNFGAGRVIADSYPVTVRIDALGLKNTTVAALVTKWGGKLTAPTTTSLRFSKTVTSREPFALPGGYTARDWQIQVETTVNVLHVALASGVGELAKL